MTVFTSFKTYVYIDFQKMFFKWYQTILQLPVVSCRILGWAEEPVMLFHSLMLVCRLIWPIEWVTGQVKLMCPMGHVISEQQRINCDFCWSFFGGIDAVMHNVWEQGCEAGPMLDWINWVLPETLCGWHWSVTQLDTVLPYSLKGRALALICCLYLFYTSYHFMSGTGLACCKVLRIACIFANAGNSLIFQ